MKKVLAVLLLVLTSPVLATDVDFYGGLEKRSRVGEPVKLLGIYPSDLPSDVLITDFYVLKDTPKTRYGDVLAYALLPNDQFLQEWLLREGRVIVMPVYDTHWGRLYTLKNAETYARLNNLGLWAEDPVVCAAKAKDAFDSFSILQGKITEAANVRGTIYLNFGADYRSDFTVKISPKTLRSLTSKTRDMLIRLTEDAKPDMVIEARGWVFYSGGPMLEIKTDAEVDFYNPGDPFILERCIS